MAGGKNGVILSAYTMLGGCRCLQTANADAGKHFIVINTGVLKSTIPLREPLDSFPYIKHLKDRSCCT